MSGQVYSVGHSSQGGGQAFKRRAGYLTPIQFHSCRQTRVRQRVLSATFKLFGLAMPWTASGWRLNVALALKDALIEGIPRRVERSPRAPTGGLAAPPDPERDPPAETRLAAQGKEAAMTASRPRANGGTHPRETAPSTPTVANGVGAFPEQARLCLSFRLGLHAKAPKGLIQVAGNSGHPAFG